MSPFSPKGLNLECLHYNLNLLSQPRGADQAAYAHTVKAMGPSLSLVGSDLQSSMLSVGQDSEAQHELAGSGGQSTSLSAATPRGLVACPVSQRAVREVPGAW
jgi:hypothetical protein